MRPGWRIEADLSNMERLARPAKSHCLGRDRAGLFLRSLAARDAAAGFHATDGTGGSGEVAHRHPLPAVGRQRKCVGRLPALMQENWAASGIGRNFALLHRKLGAGEARARHGLYDFVRRKYDISQGAADSRCRQRSAAGTDVDRNRLALISRRYLIAENGTNRHS